MAEKDPDTWQLSDAVQLRTFLANNPKFMRVLIKQRPAIEGDTMEARAVTGSDAKGFFDCVDAIEKLQFDPQQGSDNPGFIPAEAS